MTTADDLAKQKRDAEQQIRAAEQMRVKQRALFRQEIDQINQQISALQQQKSHATSELSKLG